MINERSTMKKESSIRSLLIIISLELFLAFGSCIRKAIQNETVKKVISKAQLLFKMEDDIVFVYFNRVSHEIYPRRQRRPPSSTL